MTNEEIKELLKTIRRLYRDANKGSKVTQTEFAERLKVSGTILNFILRFQSYRPGRDVLERLQKYVEKQRPESVEK